MADENKPAFYPRVGNIKAKNFKPAKPMPFIDDERAMDLPQYGDIDLSQPTKANLEMGRRMAERDAQLRRQAEADRSPLEKLAGGVQAGRFLGSALTQAINSAPTRLLKGDEAADKFMQERMYKPEQPLAYEYAGDVGDFLEKLETQYKIPPVLPEAVALQYLAGPATSQAMRTAGKGAEQAGMALERGMEPVVRGALEQGGLPREMALAMGANTQSNVMKPSNKANWLGGSSIHVPERDMWRFKTQPIAGETPSQRIPHHEELLNDPTLNLDQLDRVKYQLEQTKGEAALDNWVDTALMGYFKGQLASPTDPVRLFIEKNYATIEAKFAKDQERAARMAQRAEAEVDPRRKGNMTRQAEAMMAQARDDRDMAMQNISHLPPEMLRDIQLDPKSYIKEERVKAGFPAEGMGTTEPSKKWEHQADEAIKVTRAGDIQDAMELQPKLDKALQEQYAVHYKMGQKFGDLLREKGLDEATIESLVKSMPRSDKAEAVGMLDELQRVDSNYLKLLDQDRSFPKFAAQDNPQIAGIDPETKMYSGYMGDLGFEHVIDVLRQDVAAGRLRPDQLNKLSVEQAIRRTQEYNLERAKTMRDAKIKQQEGFPTHKEYPEGYKWIELTTPKLSDVLPEGWSTPVAKGNALQTKSPNGDIVLGFDLPDLVKNIYRRHPDTPGNPEKVLADALKYEGDTMGHCVGGYCPDVVSGRSRIYSLRDTKGEPHVTVEVRPKRPQYEDIEKHFNQAHAEVLKDMNARGMDTSDPTKANGLAWKRAEEIANENPQMSIVQIKGKQNARPIQKYDPFTQDFVKSGDWTEVGDLKNTGLYTPKQIVGEATLKTLQDQGVKIPKYLTQSEADDFMLQAIEAMEKQKPLSDLGGMKAGGKVSISNNPDTMMLEVNNQKMAKGGLSKLLRAAPKSKAEIDAIARRMAPQLLGEFVRGDKGTQSVAGKTQKQFAKEKEMVHDIRPTGAERPLPKEVDIEDLKDQVMVGIAGDPTISGQTVHSVNGIPLESPSPQHGGPFYGLGHEDDAFWASGLGAANRVQNIAREASQAYDMPVLGNYVMMGPDSINYAQHYADANLAAINPAKMSKGQIEEFNKLVREGYPYTKGKERFQRVFPAFPGIENASEAYLHFSIDPELRKHFNALMQMPTVTEKYNLPSGVDIRHAVTEPDLRDLEIGVTGKSIGRLRPEITELGLSSHPTYSHDIPGEFMGTSKYPVPYELSFPDTVKSVRENPKQAPQEFGSFKYVGPRQVIDQQLIDEIKQYQEMIKKYTGKKEGGAIKQPAAYIDGNEFVEAAKKYGIKDSMNNLNKIVDLVNKGLSVDDAARQVADTGMHKAAGGAITGDDLIIEERPL